METLLRAGLCNALAATLMAVLVLILSRPLSRRPAILHGLWLLVLMKLVTPPFYELPIPWPLASPAHDPPAMALAIVGVEVLDDEAARDDSASPVVPCPVTTGGAAADPREPPHPVARAAGIRATPFGFDQAARWIGASWLAGSAVVLALSLIRIHRFHRLLQEARPGTWPEQDWVDEWAARLGVRRSPNLWWIPGPISPMIWFVGTRPRLILPHELWKRLDARQRSTLLAHELAHLRRGDHLVRLLEMLVTVLFWWHPLVWWMRGPLREAEEQCCDAWVVWALPDAVRAYAETVLDTLEFLQPSRRPEPQLASGLGQVSHLKRRLTMIMSGTSRRLPGLPGRLGLFAAAAVLLPIGASWAQKADEPAGRFVVFSPDHLDFTAEIEIDEKLDPSALKADAKEPKISLRLQSNVGEGVELSGSLDDVIRKLESLIVDLKKEGASKPGAKAQAEALVKALGAIRSAKNAPVSFTIRADAGPEEKQKAVSIVVLKDTEKTAPSPEKAEQIARAKQEVARLRKDLDATLDQLKKAQDRLRQLGENPGETPVLGWHPSRAVPGRVLEKTYAVVRPVPARVLEKTYTVVGPNVSAGGGRALVTRPLKPAPEVTENLRVQVREMRLEDARKKPASTAADDDRLKNLEKRLCDLQDEFERIKKGAAPDGDKK